MHCINIPIQKEPYIPALRLIMEEVHVKVVIPYDPQHFPLVVDFL